MAHFNHRINRWEVRDLNTDATLARRRSFHGVCVAKLKIERGELVVGFPEPYDWAVDGIG